MEFQNSEFDMIFLGIKTQEIKELMKKLIVYPIIYLGDLTFDKSVANFLSQPQNMNHNCLHQDVDLLHFQAREKLLFAGIFLNMMASSFYFFFLMVKRVLMNRLYNLIIHKFIIFIKNSKCSIKLPKCV